MKGKYKIKKKKIKHESQRQLFWNSSALYYRQIAPIRRGMFCLLLSEEMITALNVCKELQIEQDLSLRIVNSTECRFC